MTDLHAQFESVLPRIERHARVSFRYIKCFQTKEDKIQEVRGFCWKWIAELDQDGKEWWLFVSRLADFACRAVRSGRKIVGMTARDVLSEIAQQRHGFYVGKLPDFSTESTNPLVEALTDNTVSEVPDQVAFRIDYPAWRDRFDQRDQQVIDTLALGHRTQDVARQFGLSEGRISQLRKEFSEDWRAYVSDGTA